MSRHRRIKMLITNHSCISYPLYFLTTLPTRHTKDLISNMNFYFNIHYRISVITIVYGAMASLIILIIDRFNDQY